MLISIIIKLMINLI